MGGDAVMKFVPFGSVCRLQNGRAFKPTEWVDKGVPIVRIQNLNDETKSFNYCNFEIEEKFHISSGDLLFSWSGTPGTSFGAFFWNRGKAFLNQHIFRVDVDENNVDKNYLCYAINSNLNLVIEQAHGGVGLKHITKGKLEAIEIPLPPLPEQKRIAAILDKADNLRRKRQQAMQFADEFLRAVFLDMFGDPVTNPKNWEKIRLQELTHLITDGKHGDCVDEENSGYYFISAKDIHDEIINYSNARQIRKKDFDEVHRRTDLSDGDLVMVNTGATIGKIAIAYKSDKTNRTTFQKSVAVIKPNKNLLSSVFLKYVFLLRINVFASKGAGSAIQNLLLSEMRRFEIIVPNIDLQNEFTKKVAIIEKTKKQAQISLQELDNLFNSLSQKAFAGEL